MDDNYMLMLTILEAKNIGELRSNEGEDHLIIEARFNSESIMSNCITIMDDNPSLMIELCWKISKNKFDFFRKKRKLIRIRCHMENTKDPTKNSIGSAVLPLRLVQETTKPKYVWKQLFISHFSENFKCHPEILVSLQFFKVDDNQEYRV